MSNETEPTVLSKKDQLLQDFIRGRRALSFALTSLDQADLNLKFFGGNSVNDILAHIVEWDHSAIRNVHRFLEGETVDFSPDEDNDVFNKEATAKWAIANGRQMIQMFNQSTLEVHDFIQQLTEEELFCDRGIMFKERIVNPAWLLVDVDHDLEHAKEIEDWKKKVGIGGF